MRAEDNRETIVLVACAARKLAQTAAARDLYISPLFRLARGVAELWTPRWFILSARHSLLDPAQVIRPYDLRLTKLSVQARREWASEVASQFARVQAAPARVVFLAGRAYREPLAQLLAARGHRIEVPLVGLGIGRQQAALKRLLAAAHAMGQTG